MGVTLHHTNWIIEEITMNYWCNNTSQTNWWIIELEWIIGVYVHHNQIDEP